MEKKYFEIEYTKRIGGKGTFNVKAKNEKEALNNAINLCFTGSDFKVVKEIPPTKNTAKGTGLSISI